MRNNLLVAAVLGLSVAGLAACSGGEQKETMEDAAAKVKAPSTMRSDQPTAPAMPQAAPAQPAPQAAPAQPAPQVAPAPQAQPAPDAMAPQAQPAPSTTNPNAPGPQAPQATPGPQAPQAAPGPQAPQMAPGPQQQMPQGQQQQMPQGQQQYAPPPVPDTQVPQQYAPQPAAPASDGMNSATFDPNAPNTTPGTATI